MHATSLLRSRGYWGRTVALTATCVGVLAFGAQAQMSQPFSTPNLYGFGDPFEAIKALALKGNTQDLETFGEGQATFIEVDSLPKLGPLFNSRSCATCHFQPAMGGSGSFINEIRIRNNSRPGPLQIFASDNILRAGPQTQGSMTIFPNGLESSPLGCQITSPSCARSTCQDILASDTHWSTTLPICDPTSTSFANGDNCSAERQSTALFGFGFVEAVADSTFDAIAAAQPSAIRGVVKRVTELGATRVARFGWKDDVATLRGFAGDAYLNEIGVSSPDFPNDRSDCALGQMQFGVLLDAGDDPEDTIESDGKADVDRFADFMRALASPPRLQQNATAQAGHTLFTDIGCAGCHVESLTTAANPASFIPRSTGGVAITGTLNIILAKRTFNPFSDFLLHDMGALGDGITSGVAGPRLMRTPPLWGVRAKSRLLHDGRAETIEEAVGFHDGQAAASRNAFQALTPAQQNAIVTFLGTI
ncbi:MAG TPA: di-heme oxidoredictase family protein [Candidatus Margulisiibacteriota bacterium]|nr:di-heme oxidoredictase family protein [Candidatus Margulisiibacteriota bacterium]